MTDLVLGRTWKIHWYFSHLSPNFTGGSKSANFRLDFPQQSPLTHCVFNIEELITNLIRSPWAMNFILAQTFRPSLPNFYRGSKISKFGLNLAFETLQFQKKASYLKFETHVKSSRPIPQIWLRSLPQLWELGGTKLPPEKSGMGNVLNLPTPAAAPH